MLQEHSGRDASSHRSTVTRWGCSLPLSSAGGAGDGCIPTAQASLPWGCNLPCGVGGMIWVRPLRGKNAFYFISATHPESEKQADAEAYESDSCLLSQQACTYPHYCTKIHQKVAALSSMSVPAIHQSLIGF